MPNQASASKPIGTLGVGCLTRQPLPTFSDDLAAVRRQLWAREDFRVSANPADFVELPSTTINRLIHAACHAA